jgi:hypothetical protein
VRLNIRENLHSASTGPCIIHNLWLARTVFTGHGCMSGWDQANEDPSKDDAPQDCLADQARLQGRTATDVLPLFAGNVSKNGNTPCTYPSSPSYLRAILSQASLPLLPSQSHVSEFNAIQPLLTSLLSTTLSKQASNDMAPSTIYSKPLARNEMRLMILQPGRWKDPILCQLETDTLLKQHRKREYKALSYAWGLRSRSNPPHIQVQDTLLPITLNLECALRHLRLPDEPLVL